MGGRGKAVGDDDDAAAKRPPSAAWLAAAVVAPDVAWETTMGLIPTARRSSALGIHVCVGDRSSSSRCAKKQTGLWQPGPSLQSCVRYLDGWRWASNTPWAKLHASPRRQKPCL